MSNNGGSSQVEEGMAEAQGVEIYLANIDVWLKIMWYRMQHSAYENWWRGHIFILYALSLLHLKHTLIMEELQAWLTRLLSAKSEAWLISRINDKAPDLAAARKTTKIAFLIQYLNVRVAFYFKVLIKIDTE